MEKLFVSSSPHLRSGTGVRSIMLDVIIALTPALIASVILFGLRALLVTAVSVAAGGIPFPENHEAPQFHRGFERRGHRYAAGL